MLQVDRTKRKREGVSEKNRQKPNGILVNLICGNKLGGKCPKKRHHKQRQWQRQPQRQRQRKRQIY